MMEGAISLMQMAKTSAKLTQLSDKKIPTYLYALTQQQAELLLLLLCWGILLFQSLEH